MNMVWNIEINMMKNVNQEREILFQKVIEHYKSIGVYVAEGTNHYHIEKIQNQLEYKFPDDFKTFHLMCNGFLEWDMDNFYFSIWPFDRIIEEYTKEKEEDFEFIPICDYLINAHWYGYIRNREGIFKDYDRENAIAKNFEEFLKLLLNDSVELY